MFKKLYKFVGKEIVESDIIQNHTKYAYIILDSITDEYIRFKTYTNQIFQYHKDCCRIHKIGKNVYELRIIVNHTYRIVFY